MSASLFNAPGLVAGDWTDQEIRGYLAGIRLSDYPHVFWREMLPFMSECETITDIGCGPGAFTLKALAGGFDVQAVDKNKKNLKVLAEEIHKKGWIKRCRFLQGDWLEVEPVRSDASVIAYSCSGSIGSRTGIEKIFRLTEKVVFFIGPAEKKYTDFATAGLYKKIGQDPPAFQSDYTQVAEDLDKMGVKTGIKLIEYDFGLPLENGDIKGGAIYLANKLRIKEVSEVEKHLRKIITSRHGLPWIPNPKKSVLITCAKEN